MSELARRGMMRDRPLAPYALLAAHRHREAPLAAVLVSNQGHELLVEVDAHARRARLTLHGDGFEARSDISCTVHAPTASSITAVVHAELIAHRASTDTWRELEVSVAVTWSVDQFFGIAAEDLAGHALVLGDEYSASFSALRSHAFNRHLRPTPANAPAPCGDDTPPTHTPRPTHDSGRVVPFPRRRRRPARTRRPIAA